MILTLMEIIDVIIITLALGFIFKDFFKMPKRDKYEPLDYYKKGRFDFSNFKFAIMVTAPAVIMHELAHKFVAISYGVDATLHAAYTFLGIGIVLKLLNFGFIFFVPGYVSHAGASLAQSTVIAVAGPAMNFLIWIGTIFLLKTNIKQKYRPFLILTGKINMFLFIFNMLPIPPFDGYHFFSGLYKLLF